MLVSFSVKNFMCFRDKITLSMESSNGEENKENKFSVLDTELLKTTAIYGANASGKSSLIKAFNVAINIVKESDKISLGSKWKDVKPFLLDDLYKFAPSEFEFIFIKNGIKYKYIFSCDENIIHYESLEIYYSQKPTTIFLRNEEEYKFYYKDEKILEEIKEKTTDNKLFLSTAACWNYDKVKEAFLWFKKDINSYLNDNKLDVSIINKYSENEELLNFAIKILNESDILINNIIIDKSEYSVIFKHNVITTEGNNSTYDINYEDESSGTKILFGIIPYLKEAFDNQKIIIIDELEKSLHPSLVEFIIKIFNNKSINKANSQLIFTTHNTSLMKISLLRRDQIWFIEKDYKTGIADAYSLSDFSVRKDENIQKGYLYGRYGAVPYIKEVSVWEDILEQTLNKNH